MKKTIDIALTALAPIIWGSTYYVTTEFLPAGYPITAAMLRALPAGLLLLVIIRQLPFGHWWWRILVLGALNFTIFWVLLFVAAYRLPGGIAASLGAIQPLVIIFLAYICLYAPIRIYAIIAAIMGAFGVALLMLTSKVQLDVLGCLAALGGALAMALGTILTKKWQPPVSLLTFTAWQLTAGGLLLLPLSLYLEPALPPLTQHHILGFVWLGLMGAAVSYYLLFRGIIRLDVTTVSMLGFLSPMTAVLLGWFLLGQQLTPWQWIGVLLVLLSIRISQLKKV